MTANSDAPCSRAAIRFMALVSPEARCSRSRQDGSISGRGPQVGPRGRDSPWCQICGECRPEIRHTAQRPQRPVSRGGAAPGWTRWAGVKAGPSAAAPARKLAVISESPSCLARKNPRNMGSAVWHRPHACGSHHRRRATAGVPTPSLHVHRVGRWLFSNVGLDAGVSENSTSRQA